MDWFAIATTGIAAGVCLVAILEHRAVSRWIADETEKHRQTLAKRREELWRPHDEFSALIKKAEGHLLKKAESHVMTDAEIEIQRASLARGLSARCEHGKADFEQCPKCRGWEED